VEDPDALWTEVARRGTPLVDPVPGTDAEVFLTYPWRATDPAVTAVELHGTPVGSLNEVGTRHPLTRVGGSDTWVATFRAPAEAVHLYGFSELTGADRTPLTEKAGPDPHARWQYPGPEAPLDVPTPPDDWAPVLSVADLRPDAGRVRPTVPAGVVQEHEFASEVLGNTRRLWSYTPPEYDGRGAWLVLLHDGWQWRSPSPVAPILDELIAGGLIPPTVLVMQESPPGQRGPELLGNERFADAMVGELVPWARETWGLTADPARTVVAGQSYGGLNASYLALRHPDVFGHVLCQSGSFWHWHDPDPEEWLIASVLSTPRQPVRFHLDVGLLEGPTMVAANRRMRDALVERGYEHTYRETAGDHSWASWERTLGAALRWVTTP
jgi:enterochelin esterase family protein